MALSLVLLHLIVLYVRPGEVIPGWEGFPFSFITQIAAAIAVAVSVVLRPHKFWNQPQDRYFLGFSAITLLSSPLHGWLGGAWVALQKSDPQVLGYFLIRAVVRSTRDLRWIAYVILAATLFQALNGISEFRTGVGIGGVAAIETYPDQDEDDGQIEQVRRIRGTGIFNDPNDLAMAFVAVMPLLVGPLVRQGSALAIRGLCAAVLAPFLAALYYTNSRGGVLGLGAALLPYCLRRGKTLGLVLGATAVAALIALGPSRMSDMDTDESSAQGRVQSWSEGLQMFKAQPLLGVGYDRYTEFNPLVAHNSFIHTLAELGLPGAFFFTGMLYWLFRGTRPPTNLAEAPSDRQRLGALGQDLRAAGLGMCVCAMFLSRQYSSVLCNTVAMSASYLQLVRAGESSGQPRSAKDIVYVGVTTVALIGVMYVLVRALAQWGG